MKLFFILLIVFIVGLYFLGPILLLPVILYLAVGLAIFVIGTWPASAAKKNIIRRGERKFALKEENIKVKLLVSAKGLPPVTGEREPWNIVLAIDNSSSMMGTPLGNAKIAARNIVSTTPADFRFALVEFQEHAHIRCSLTTNRMKLKTTVRLLVSEGDTAIHEGLRLAYQVLKEELTPGKKNAVILLSDGASDPAPALEQAQNLKNQGVVIYSVGLGHCDRELMRKIASHEDTYFHTKESEGLKELYYNIGNIISGARAREVEITEHPNIKKGHFHIVQWGEIEPTLLDFDALASAGKDKPAPGAKAMSVYWYLPSLDAGEIPLEYYIRPRCYGWYRVSEAVAQLKFKDRQGKTHTFSSKKGPKVLIIPRFFLWQIFWVFLNPLFWKIFRHLRCKGEGIGEPPTYQIPERVPITQPDILPTLETGFKLSVTPTLALGIGYGGINALTHFKRLLWEHNEDQEIKNKVIFCGLDTVKPWLSDTVKIGHISLDMEEKLNIHAPVSNFIKQQAEKKTPTGEYAWLNAKEKLTRAIDYDIGFGTNLDRGIGRLMVLEQRDKFEENHDTVNLKTMIRELYEKNKGENLQVCIAATLNGGTSSGVILDLCYTLRKILEELNIVGVGINLFLMDYQVEDNDPHRDVKKPVIQLNKTGMLNELARFFAARDEDFSPLPRDKPQKRWYDRITWVDKKPETANLADLYPQCGLLMYHWAVEKHFRDLLLNHTEYIHTGLLVHKFETDAVFFFKRTLEQYYSVRLLLTTLGNLLLGLPEYPPDYSVDSVKLDEKYIDAAFDLLYKNPRWTNARPFLLRQRKLVEAPKPGDLSQFIKYGGMSGLVESSSQDRINNYLDQEESRFGNLLDRWLEAILGTYQDKETSTTAFKEKKLPTAYFTLRRLKENFQIIRELAEQVPDTWEYTVKKNCHTTAEMCTRFNTIINQWLKKLGQWWDILGTGTEQITGICQRLNALLNELEKSIDNTKAYTAPYFAFDDKVEEKIYQRYFAQLEHRILDQLHWEVEAASKQTRLLIVNDEEVKRCEIQLNKPSIYDDLFNELLALPVYFAGEQNKWHEASVHEIMELTREAGQDVIDDYLVPRALKTTLTNLLYLDPKAAEVLDQRISAGLERETAESKNPLVSGFFKYKLNHEVVSTKTKFNPRELPSYVYPEEWNCYHALKIYSNLVDEQPLTPSYMLVAVCRDMKKFLGAVYQGIIQNQIESRQSGSQMVYRFHSLEVTQSKDSDGDIINLMRLITGTQDVGLGQVLQDGYEAVLKMNLKTIKAALTRSKLELSDNLREQLIQVTAGAVEYYKNLE